ncbi:MAG TPA: MGMT family protein [Solirubrobacteraceae bacterium]|nr:MGMT family protein [Solirubrobacteraceae bacterium]
MADVEVILARVRRVPPGFVTTYGDLSPGAPRQAGRALSQAPPGAVPWWRVVRSDGSLTQGTEQKRLLKGEGVPMRGERVIMREAQIPPEAIP